MKEVNNSETTFLEWYSLYNDGIFRFCLLKTSNRNVALDLTQETFSKLWEYISSGKEVEQPKAFLYRISTNLVIDYYRKKKSSSLDILIEKGFDPSNDQDLSSISNTEIRELRENLEKLDDIHKDVLILRYVNDLSVKEIADTYGEHQNTVSVRIHRGIEKLKKLYKTHE